VIYDLLREPRPVPSARQLDQWVRDARELTGGAEQRIGWVLASTVVIAALQRILGHDGRPLFLVKGGLYLELQLGLKARATKDVTPSETVDRNQTIHPRRLFQEYLLVKPNLGLR